MLSLLRKRVLSCVCSFQAVRGSSAQGGSCALAPLLLTPCLGRSSACLLRTGAFPSVSSAHSVEDVLSSTPAQRPPSAWLRG